MKKLFIVCALAATTLPALAEGWHAEKALSLPGSDLSSMGKKYVAYDKSSSKPYSLAYALTNGSDVTFFILDENLETDKQFTVNSVLNTKCRVQTLEFDDVDIPNLLVSKGIFTDEDKWCVTITDTSGDTRTLVYTEDSKLLGELPGGDKVANYYAQLTHAHLFTANSPIYLNVTENQSTGASTLYRFTGSSGVESIATGKAMNAYPNPVHRGENLTISLPQATVPNTTISVTDLNGKLVYNSMVSEGNETVTVPTGELPLGWLLYTVANSKGIITGKFCVE